MKLAVSFGLALAALPLFAASAQTAPATAPAAPAAKFNLDTPIEALIADDKAKSVLDADLPGLSSHPALEQFKAMSLRAVQPFSNGALTEEILKKVETDLSAIK